MDNSLLIVLILLFVIVNLVPVIILAVNDRDPDQGAANSLKLSQVLMLFSLLGGGIGILLGFLVYPEQVTKRRIQAAAIGAAAWLAVLCAAAFIPEKTPGPDYGTRQANGPGVQVSTKAASSSDTEPYASSSSEYASVEGSESASEEATTITPTTRPPRQTTYISLVAIGDMLMHTGVSSRAFMPDGTVDYRFIFEPIKNEVRNADIAVVNNEVPFGGNQYGLRNYPLFNVFTELGDEEVRAGFDVVLCATNHVMDMTSKGLENTMNFWKKYPAVTVLGVHETQEDQDTLKIIERDGVKIALYNCTYGINSYGVPDDRPYMVDLMRMPEQDRIRKYLERAEKEADFTIVFPHWGSEYHLTESSDQRYWATFFTQYGADLIIGTHPHVLEPVKTVTSSNGNTSLCYYSLGNYISLQDETFSVLGGMAKVTLVADNDGVRVHDHGMQYLVTHYGADINYPYVLKLEDYTQDLASQHGILLKGLPGDGYNVNYPFSVNTLHRIVDQIEGRIADARVYPEPETISPPISAPPEENTVESTEEDVISSEDMTDTEDTEPSSEEGSDDATTSRPPSDDGSDAPDSSSEPAEESSTEVPTESSTEPPVTEPFVTETPVTEPPVTEPPVTEPPVTEPPVTEPEGTVPSEGVLPPEGGEGGQP
ncbi:MAG: CapA family protein [Lachnospiraceae bacterium]|nr:CapA family protein [Lachnospiraceae bacterium]